MGDYFDDDDLVEMDVDDGPPPPYDDEYLEGIEMEFGPAAGAGAACGTKDAAGAADGFTTATNPIGAAATSNVAMDDDDYSNDDDGIGMRTTGIDEPPRVIVADPLKNVQESSAEREKRLYGFER